MKKVVCAVLVGMTLLLVNPVPSQARHGHVFIGGHVVVGPIWWGPRFWWGPPAVWYPPYYPAPPVVYQPPSPAIQAEPPAQVYWYYCENPQGYYPYVKECPGGWRQVAPQPTPSNP
ncbi:MAG TPA: hypothetical protein VLT62_19515 [Candidatus Methylomirabilis sp.]|nr:hypothetical protein [Candidatus Methylomirabilis sp.]